MNIKKIIREELRKVLREDGEERPPRGHRDSSHRQLLHTKAVGIYRDIQKLLHFIEGQDDAGDKYEGLLHQALTEAERILGPFGS